MNHNPLGAEVPEFMATIRPHTGDVTGVRPSSRGHGSASTAVVDCEKGPVFVKAVPNRPGGRRDSLIREGLINIHVRPISPVLRWQAQDDAWIVLGFEVIHARPADFTPGSPDLPAVLDLLARIGDLPLPAVAADWPETRWDHYTSSPADAELLRGDALLYTDINPDNLLIGDQASWAVDWSWPTRGAAFIDPACLIIQLIAAGHSPASAETQAQALPAWKSADPAAVRVFAAANLRMYTTLADRSPDATWLTAMADATACWLQHRGADAGHHIGHLQLRNNPRVFVSLRDAGSGVKKRR